MPLQKNESEKNYVIGIDVGNRGLGLAAFEVDDAGYPINKLSMLTVRIDGGVLPGSEKSPLSRKAAAGQARRVMRMRRRKKKRLEALDRQLRVFGYPVPTGEVAQTYEPWEARARLAKEFIEDPVQRNRDAVTALRHIARHRGWRNPWLSWATFLASPYPSENLAKMVQQVGSRWNRDLDDLTVGELGQLVAHRDILMRPRTRRDKGLAARGELPAFSEKILQSDQAAEVRKFWLTQKLPEEQLATILNLVFLQQKPSVPAENIGRDPIPEHRLLPRAMRASLEFQDFRIVHVVANLKIRAAKGAASIADLSEKQRETALALLRDWHLDHEYEDAPTWTDVADAIQVEPYLLVKPALDDVVGVSAPFNKSLAKFEGKLKSIGKVGDGLRLWWQQADSAQRSLFLRAVLDPSDATEAEFEASGLSDLFEGQEEAIEMLSNVQLEAGRAAYSVETLRRLAQRMETEGLMLHLALNSEFGLPQGWRPPAPRFDELTGQPAVDQNLAVIRKFVMNAVRKWGVPSAVNVEHVRSAFMGAEALQEYKAEQRRILRERESADKALREIYGRDTKRIDRLRYEYLQRQNSQCAYCGTGIGLDCEIDHIVPRTGGGASTSDNLVAVCRLCNSRKGALPFRVFCERDSRPEVSLEQAEVRVRGWLKAHSTISQRRQQRKLIQRLRQTTDDEPIDERSMATTAYAALAIRARLQGFLDENTSGRPGLLVMAYSGRIISAARKASGVDRRIILRGHEFKHRGDFRHHAIDAAVIALMNPVIAQVLALREARRISYSVSGQEPGWREFRGATPAQVANFQLWQQQWLFWPIWSMNLLNLIVFRCIISYGCLVV